MIKVGVGKLTKLYGQNSQLVLDISNIINPFMHNVWPFYNIMHERVKEKNGNQLGLYFVKKKIRGISYTKCTGKNCRIIWLQNVFYYLKNEHKNILTTKDAWLNDRIMDADQKLIRKVLGKIGSFQSVLNSQKNQITHSEQLTTSTYSCYMTETTIDFFPFVPMALFRYAIA